MKMYEVNDCLHNWNYGDGIRWCPGCGTSESAQVDNYTK